MDWIYSPEIWASLLTLTALEIVLGIDNIVMIAVIANALPPEQRDRARLIGLSLALITRLLLLFTISWIAGLIQPLFHVWGQPFSGRDLIMLGGGLFLIWKAVHEMHQAVEEAGSPGTARVPGSFAAAIAQIVVLDIVFSFDSVITAVGMANELWVMVTAVVIAVVIMLVASGPIMRFIHAHPTVKMLALAFVLLIGMALVADGFRFHIPKGYLYAAMAFSVLVESLNVIVSRRRARAAAHTAAASMDQPKPTDVGVVLVPLDGSAPSFRGLEEVVALVKRGYDFDIHLVNVQPTLRTPVGSQDAIRDYMMKQAETVFAAARELLKTAGLVATEHVVTGTIGERIVRLAAELRAVRIVMGSHGRDRASELILGSVATEVLRHAVCPVTLVK